MNIDEPPLTHEGEPGKAGRIKKNKKWEKCH